MLEIPQTPTKKLIERFLEMFHKDERYFRADQAITALFDKFPTNKEMNHVLLKVTVLNDLYGTNIYGTFEMAHHICSLPVDVELGIRSTKIVDKIANANFSGKPRQVFSFATKYCSWHDKENYPLYDSYVAKLLVAYHHKDNFKDFKNDELRHYTSFKAVVSAFREHYMLAEYSFKELDKFLWLYGKHLFPKRYDKTNNA